MNCGEVVESRPAAGSVTISPTLKVRTLTWAINPLDTVLGWSEGLGLLSFAGRVAYPARLAYWPAVVFYIALIWLNSLLGMFLTPLFIVPGTWLLDWIKRRKGQQTSVDTPESGYQG